MKRRHDLFSSSIDGASNGSFSFFFKSIETVSRQFISKHKSLGDFH